MLLRASASPFPGHETQSIKVWASDFPLPDFTIAYLKRLNYISVAVEVLVDSLSLCTGVTHSKRQSLTAIS